MRFVVARIKCYIDIARPINESESSTTTKHNNFPTEAAKDSPCAAMTVNASCLTCTATIALIVTPSRSTIFSQKAR